MNALGKIPNHNYLISKEKDARFNRHFNIDEYIFQYGDTNAIRGSMYNKEIVIFGEIIDCRMPYAPIEEILKKLLSASSLIELINDIKKMAGRFIIAYSSKEGFFVVPDATASIHVAYTVPGNLLYISSNPKIIADINLFEESGTSKSIKDMALETYPLPYDLTMYDNIKMVIPNHYLDVVNRKAVRYYPLTKSKDLSTNQVAEFTSKVLKNIIKGYIFKHKLSLPLTAGIDSRTILSVCREFISEIPTYTFLHKGFKDNTADISIPKGIATMNGFNHFIIKDLDLTDDVVRLYEQELGGDMDRNEALNSWTYFNSEFRERYRLDGNISPLAKSNFGRNLHEILATPSYLVTKTHNYSRKNYEKTKEWLVDINEFTKLSSISKYDLFFWEHRVGRWTANSFLNADLLVNQLNPFNCRWLIEAWLRVPRKNRMRGEIHKSVIRINWPELLEFPFNPDNKFGFLYKYKYLYYLAVRAKYIVGKYKHMYTIK